PRGGRLATTAPGLMRRRLKLPVQALHLAPGRPVRRSGPGANESTSALPRDTLTAGRAGDRNVTDSRRLGELEHVECDRGAILTASAHRERPGDGMTVIERHPEHVILRAGSHRARASSRNREHPTDTRAVRTTEARLVIDAAGCVRRPV